MKLHLKDPIGERFGTVLTYGVLIALATWAGLELMHYHALAYRHTDIPLPEWVDHLRNYAVAIYLAYRKGENANLANRLSAQVNTKGEIAAVTEDGVG